MRAGGCTVQQALTVEAANVVKQAVALARRRGHAQVTPLHVANTMLAASNGLLRTACLQSHSHPLQCKALELCFNVALNRLPASSSSPILGHHHHHHHSQQYPTISNALVAAFKRAQAHQRRGSIETQQQPLLAVKIELEQLIISILDDPSVSRVMREAGFSSSQVKNNVEQAVSLELCSHQIPSSTRNKSSLKENNLLLLSQQQQQQQPQQQPESAGKANNPTITPTAADHQVVKDEDVISLIKCLMNGRKKSIVVVGECISNIDGVVKGLMDKIDKGNVPESLKEVKFISIPLISFGHHHHSREESEQKIKELTHLVRRLMNKGVILYLGDLKWISDFIWASSSSSSSSGDHHHQQQQQQQVGLRSSINNYCPVEHMITEFGRLMMSVVGENGKCWLMGIATFQTYMRCSSSSSTGQQRSLETIWGLHPVTLPAAGSYLSLSISTDQSDDDESRRNTARNGYCNQLIMDSSQRGNEEMIQLNCCSDCSAKFENEARSLQTPAISNSESTLSSLPSWLKEESKRLKDNDQNCMPVKELCKKWNKVCSSFHKQTSTFSSTNSPSSSTSFFSYDHLHHHQQSCRDVDDVVLQQQQQQPFWAPPTSTTTKYGGDGSFRRLHSNNTTTTTSTPNSAASSSDNNNINIMEMEYYLPKFKEFNCENLNILCNALEQKVPWQKDVIPDIAGTILQCRSGMVRRKFEEKLGRKDSDVMINKEETWLFFQGMDVEAKENIGRELAKIIFGSYSKFISIALISTTLSNSYSSSSSAAAAATELLLDMKNKRCRDELDHVRRLGRAISDDPHRVFFVEDIEQADLCSRVGIKRAMQKGRIIMNNGEGEEEEEEGEVSLSDAIIILSGENLISCSSNRSRACSPPVKQKIDSMDQVISPNCVSLDLNLSFDDDDDGNGNGNGNGECNHDDELMEEEEVGGILENVDRRIDFRMREL